MESQSVGQDSETEYVFRHKSYFKYIHFSLPFEKSLMRVMKYPSKQTELLKKPQTQSTHSDPDSALSSKPHFLSRLH